MTTRKVLLRGASLGAIAIATGGAAWLLHTAAGELAPLAAQVPLQLAGAGVPLMAGFMLSGAAGAAWAREGQVVAVPRSENDTHGHADWATPEAQRRRFWQVDPDHGCMVVAEIRRRDREPVHGVLFEPRDRETWGEGGKGELLVDDARLLSGHVLGFMPPGTGKSSSILPTLCHPRLAWRGDYIGGDPKGENGRQSRRFREQVLGHTVYEIGHGKDGINIFDVLDPRKSDFETDVQALVGNMYASGAAAAATKASGGGDDAKWEAWGKTLVCALVAHICTSLDMDDEDRDPTFLYSAVSRSAASLRNIMRQIAEDSPSRFAQRQARSVLVEAKDTFDGVFINAQGGLSWLSNPSYANMVSVRSFRPQDLGRGDKTVFIQVSPKALKQSPAVARCLYGVLLEALYDMQDENGESTIHGRCLCDIDEAFQLGAMEILERIRDLGRAARIVLRLWFQSVGQLVKLWGQDGKGAWYAAVAYRMYAGVNDPDTAEEVSKACGTYTARLRQKGSSFSQTGKGLVAESSRTWGENENESEAPRALLLPHEVLQEVGGDEVIIVVPGMRPIRAGLPLGWRIPEVQEVLRTYSNDNVSERNIIQAA
jgi:type IV secretion system protein VirD4